MQKITIISSDEHCKLFENTAKVLDLLEILECRDDTNTKLKEKISESIELLKENYKILSDDSSL